MYFRTQAQINLDALEYNVKNTRKKLPEGVKLLGVIKADAYGHGAVEIGKFIENYCDFFGIACLDEALELINAGIKKPLLILGTVSPNDFETVVKHDIRVPVFSFESAKALSDEAKKQGKYIPFHFCIDTGMSRIGFQANEESADTCSEICKLPNIIPEGMFSHLATADEADLTKAKNQVALFKNFASMLEERGINIPIKHINNSAGIINFDEYFDMCRMGIIAYGLYPSEDVDKSVLDIKPVMRWVTNITYIKNLPAGREISYGGTFVTEKETTVATVPVGYADGYPRCLSNKGCVLIGGKRAKILGRVCMDQFMVDVSDIPCAIGDEVVLVGKQQGDELSMEEVSNAAYSFNYELPCRVSKRIPRNYFKDGKLIKTVKYI